MTTKIIRKINNKRSQLHYILNRDDILGKMKVYNEKHSDVLKITKTEWDAKKTFLRGLCHICLCSNVEIFNHKGQILCDSCLEDQLNG